MAEQAATIYRAFHARASDLKINTLCVCDGCQQAGNLKIKLVGHLGEAAVQKVKHLTELAGVDVILVHRMLKNDVPVPEYLLMTEPVHRRVDPSIRERSAAHPLDLDDLGPTDIVLRRPRTLRRRSAAEPAALARREARAPLAVERAVVPGAHRLGRGVRGLP